MGSGGQLISRRLVTMEWKVWLQATYKDAPDEDPWEYVAARLIEQRPTLGLISPWVKAEPVQTIEGGGG